MDIWITVQKLFLSKKNLDPRILWNRTHQNWTINEWGKFAFTDKWWRLLGTKLHQRQIVPTFKSGYQTVSVWGGFPQRGLTPFVAKIGSVGRHMYRKIVSNHVLPFFYDVHGRTDAFILQDDNCAPHWARHIATYLEPEDITHMKCLE